MPKANGGEGRWVGVGGERNEGRMEGRRVRYGDGRRDNLFSSSKFLISRMENLGVSCKFLNFIWVTNWFKRFFKIKIFHETYFFSSKIDIPFSTFFSSKIQYGFWTNFFSSTIQSAFWDEKFRPKFNLPLGHFFGGFFPIHNSIRLLG